MKQRLMAFLSGASFVITTAWMFGFDFNQRGFEAGMVFMFSVFAGTLFATFPGLDK